MNRIDDTIIFNKLEKDGIRAIATLMLNDVKARITALGINVTFDESVAEAVAKEGFDPVYGARPLKRYLQSRVETLIARKIIAADVNPGDTLLVDTEGERLIVR